MTSLVRRLLTPRSELRSGEIALTLDQYAQQLMQFGGLTYGLGNQTLSGSTEDIEASFTGYVEGAFKSNGIIFACVLARIMVFAEARFQYQRLREGRPGKLWSNADLGLLEKPWPNGSTGDLLVKMLMDSDLAGNAYIAKLRKDRLTRLRPDWVTIMLGSMSSRKDWEPGDIDTEVIGYLYHPGGRNSSRQPVPLLPENVAHFAPTQDPSASYRGMSWITPVITEIMGDKAAMEHKQKYFSNGATVNLVAKLPESVKSEAFKTWVELFKDAHAGHWNAYETVFMGGGADLVPIGSDMKQVDFAVTQAHGEARICAAARVPAIYAGITAGLESSTYSNAAHARRVFADGTLRYLWRCAAEALGTLVAVPSDSRLWIDTRDIAFLQEDSKDEADIQFVQAQTIRQLTDAGFEPDSVVESVIANDYGLLVHRGLLSVQLFEPTAQTNGTVPAIHP